MDLLQTSQQHMPQATPRELWHFTVVVHALCVKAITTPLNRSGQKAVLPEGSINMPHHQYGRLRCPGVSRGWPVDIILVHTLSGTWYLRNVRIRILYGAHRVEAKLRGQLHDTIRVSSKRGNRFRRVVTGGLGMREMSKASRP